MNRLAHVVEFSFSLVPDHRHGIYAKLVFLRIIDESRHSYGRESEELLYFQLVNLLGHCGSLFSLAPQRSCVSVASIAWGRSSVGRTPRSQLEGRYSSLSIVWAGVGFQPTPLLHFF